MLRTAYLIVILVLISVPVTGPLAATADAGVDRAGVDVFLGGGIGGDPRDDDLTGHISVGAGYRGSHHWAVGLEGYRTKFTYSGTRILVGPYVKAYPFYNPFVNPYGRAGLGLANLKTGNSEFDPDSRFNLIPQIAVGLEAGFSSLALYGELSQRFHVRNGHGSEYDNVSGITVGLSLHFFESDGRETDRQPGRIR